MDLVAYWTQSLFECIIVRGGSVLMVSTKHDNAWLIGGPDCEVYLGLNKIN